MFEGESRIITDAYFTIGDLIDALEEVAKNAHLGKATEIANLNGSHMTKLEIVKTVMQNETGFYQALALKME